MRCFRAISADRRGIEPDAYVFQVPEHEEGPLGPLRITDRRGNIRTENILQFREPTKPSESSPSTNPSTEQTHRRSVLARLFARRKTDSQESSLVKGSSSPDDSNSNRISVRIRTEKKLILMH